MAFFNDVVEVTPDVVLGQLVTDRLEPGDERFFEVFLRRGCFSMSMMLELLRHYYLRPALLNKRVHMWALDCTLFHLSMCDFPDLNDDMELLDSQPAGTENHEQEEEGEEKEPASSVVHKAFCELKTSNDQEAFPDEAPERFASCFTPAPLEYPTVTTQIMRALCFFCDKFPDETRGVIFKVMSRLSEYVRPEEQTDSGKAMANLVDQYYINIFETASQRTKYEFIRLAGSIGRFLNGFVWFAPDMVRQCIGFFGQGRGVPALDAPIIRFATAIGLESVEFRDVVLQFTPQDEANYEEFLELQLFWANQACEKMESHAERYAIFDAWAARQALQAARKTTTQVFEGYVLFETSLAEGAEKQSTIARDMLEAALCKTSSTFCFQALLSHIQNSTLSSAEVEALAQAFLAVWIDDTQLLRFALRVLDSFLDERTFLCEGTDQLAVQIASKAAQYGDQAADLFARRWLPN